MCVCVYVYLCVSLYVNVCVCVHAYVYVCSHASVHVCVCTCGSQRLLSDAYLSCGPSYFLTMSCSLCLELSSWLKWLVMSPRDHPDIYLLAEITGVHLALIGVSVALTGMHLAFTGMHLAFIWVLL